MIDPPLELRGQLPVEVSASNWSTHMSNHPNAFARRLLVGSLVLAWPLLAFAEPPAGPAPDGMGPGHCAMHDGPMGHMGPMDHMGPMGGMGPGGEHEWSVRPHFLHGLRLSEEQQDKVFAVLADQRRHASVETLEPEPAAPPANRAIAFTGPPLRLPPEARQLKRRIARALERKKAAPPA
jgi:hypothetical protein